MNQFIYKALNDKELNDGEFRLYMLIKELANNNAGYCYGRNQSLAKIIGKHETNISKIISKLIEKEYIYTIHIKKGSIVEERRLYTEETYKTYLQDLDNSEKGKLIKTHSLKMKLDEEDETTIIVNERNVDEYMDTGNKIVTGNENTTGTSNENTTRTGSDIVKENIYNINNNNINNKKILSNDNIQKVQEEWNTLANELELPKIDKIDGKRLTNLNARVKKHGIEKFLEVMGMIRNSKFLRGEINDFRATFDFLVTASSFEKIRQKNYESKGNKNANDKFRRLMEL